jgi:hypothetical protein
MDPRFRGDDRLLLTADKPFSLTEADHYVITAVIILLAVGAFACRWS